MEIKGWKPNNLQMPLNNIIVSNEEPISFPSPSYMLGPENLHRRSEQLNSMFLSIISPTSLEAQEGL